MNSDAHLQGPGRRSLDGNLLDRPDELQACEYRTSRIVFVCPRVAEIYENPVAEILCDVAVEPLHDRSAYGMVRVDHGQKRFGIEVRRELGGCHQVAEQDRQLTTLRARIIRHGATP